MKPKAPSALYCFRRFPVLSGLPDHALQALADAAVSRQLSRGSVVYAVGDRAEHVYCLHGGRVDALLESTGGRTINVGDFSGGAVFGERCLWQAASAEREDTAITTAPSLVTIVPRLAFRVVLDQHPAVERAIVAQSLARRDATMRRLSDALTLTARARVVDQLLRLAEVGRDTPGGRAFTQPYRQRELAALVGSTRETVAHELRRLEQARLIQRSGRHFVVPDLGQLRAARRDAVAPTSPGACESSSSPRS